MTHGPWFVCVCLIICIRIAIDRFFGSPALAEWFIAEGGEMTGMWDTRKGPCPAWLKLASKKPTRRCPKGTIRSASALEGRLWAIAFMDNAGCYMLDTSAGGQLAELPRMQKKGKDRGKTIPVTGPLCNVYYQQTMGVIDGQDSMRCSKKGFGSVALSRRRRKWTNKFFDNMLDFANMAGGKLYMAIHAGTSSDLSYIDILWDFHDFLISSPGWWGTATRSKAATETTGDIPEGVIVLSGDRAGEKIVKVESLLDAPTADQLLRHTRSSKIYPSSKAKAAFKKKLKADMLKPTAPDDTERDIKKWHRGNFLQRDCRACIIVAKEAGKKKGGKKDGEKVYRKAARTVYGCPDCDPPVPLHPGECHKHYHSMVQQGLWQPYKGRGKYMAKLGSVKTANRKKTPKNKRRRAKKAGRTPSAAAAGPALNATSPSSVQVGPQGARPRSASGFTQRYPSRTKKAHGK